MIADRAAPAPRPALEVAGPAAVALALRSSPNPFNPRLTLDFTLPTAGWARLVVHDLRGRVVRELFAEDRPAGADRDRHRHDAVVQFILGHCVIVTARLLHYFPEARRVGDGLVGEATKRRVRQVGVEFRVAELGQENPPE